MGPRAIHGSGAMLHNMCFASVPSYRVQGSMSDMRVRPLYSASLHSWSRTPGLGRTVSDTRSRTHGLGHTASYSRPRTHGLGHTVSGTRSRTHGLGHTVVSDTRSRTQGLGHMVMVAEPVLLPPSLALGAPLLLSSLLDKAPRQGDIQEFTAVRRLAIWDWWDFFSGVHGSGACSALSQVLRSSW